MASQTNTFESAFTPKREHSFANLIVTIGVLAGIGWLVMRFFFNAPTAETKYLDSHIKPETTVVGQYGWYNGQRITMCAAVNSDCGTLELGKPADYGAGFHTSADGRVRPNPPAGQHSFSDTLANCKAQGLRVWEDLTPDGKAHAGYHCAP